MMAGFHLADSGSWSRWLGTLGWKWNRAAECLLQKRTYNVMVMKTYFIFSQLAKSRFIIANII